MFFLAVLALTAGCGGQGPGLESVPSTTAAQPDLSGIQGDRTVIVQSSDVGARPVLVHHPDSVGAHAPLVVVLHGEGAGAARARDELGWNAVADGEGFVVAYPQGFDHAWNAGPSCCFPHDRGVNDIGYLNQTLSALTKQDLIDRSRVYVVGFSAGGSMAYTWECAHPGVLAGVGAVDAKLLIGCPVVAPVSLAAVYGGTDTVVPAPDLTAVPDPAGAGAALAVFRGIDMCPTQPASAITGSPATESSWNCVATHSVSAAVVQGVGHQWPGAATPSGRTAQPASAHGTAAADTTTSPSGTDPATTSFNTDEWLWSHLRDARSR